MEERHLPSLQCPARRRIYGSRRLEPVRCHRPVPNWATCHNSFGANWPCQRTRVFQPPSSSRPRVGFGPCIDRVGRQRFLCRPLGWTGAGAWIGPGGHLRSSTESPGRLTGAGQRRRDGGQTGTGRRTADRWRYTGLCGRGGGRSPHRDAAHPRRSRAVFRAARGGGRTPRLAGWRGRKPPGGKSGRHVHVPQSEQVPLRGNSWRQPSAA